MRRVLIPLVGIWILAAAPAQLASADVGDAESTPASCMAIEAAAVSPPGSSDELPGGMPGLRQFIGEVAPGVPPGQAFFAVAASLHERSHEACDQALEG